MKKVLIIEDEASIRGFVVVNLKRAGYDIIEAETGEEGLEKLEQNPDTSACLIDLMLPGIDGIEVVRRIRSDNQKIGIIMLTARAQELDKINGLAAGSDDYITQPFSPTELIARLDAVCRRVGILEEEKPKNKIVSGDLVLNLENRTLDKAGKRIRLTQVEYSIIKLFMENPDKALSREDILNQVWGRDYFGELKIVDVNIRRLRMKIEDDATNPEHITTVWGYGYKWGE